LNNAFALHDFDQNEGQDTAHNSVLAVRFAHPNAFDTSQTQETLYAIPNHNP
jgi:hypothetical protein